MIFPDNFDFLHKGGEFIRSKSKEAIQKSEVLLHHLNMVADSMNLIDHFARVYPHQDDDQLVVQLLGVRLFNSTAGAVQDLMAGYYQNAVMHLRDILEVSFLLDYFHTDKALVAAWKACSESERNRQFSAFRVRTTLDERDGFTEKKRMEHYQLLCNLGAHATFQGFELLRPFAGGDAHCGPYFADRALDATMAELAKVAVGAAGNFTMFFDPHVPDFETKLHFMEAQSTWFAKFFGQPLDVGQIGKMRELLERAKAAPRYFARREVVDSLTPNASGREEAMSTKSPEDVEAEKRKLLSLYTAIGQFVFEFSQLEFIIRHALGEALALKETGANAQFDIVTAPYDFVALCNVTKAIFMRTMGCDESEQKEIESIMNACMALNNEERVPIAHGTWFIDETRLGARHVPRTKLEMTVKYSKIADIDAAAQKAATLKSRLIKFIIGPIPTNAA